MPSPRQRASDRNEGGANLLAMLGREPAEVGAVFTSIIKQHLSGAEESNPKARQTEIQRMIAEAVEKQARGARD